MTEFPQDDPERPLEAAGDATVETGTMPPREILAEGVPQAGTFDIAASTAETPIIQIQPEPPLPPRIPHLGHFLLVIVLLAFGFIGAIIVTFIALHFHFDGVSTLEDTKTNIHYTLGLEGLWYLFTLLGCIVVFPLQWHKSLFAGLQWNGARAGQLWWRLVGAAFICLLLALLNSMILPGPEHAPIEDIFREKGAAWLLFTFGVTFAPFFEEMFFRGFLLPTLCTALDWTDETFNSRRNPLPEKIGNSFMSVTIMLAVAAVFLGIPLLMIYGIIHRQWLLAGFALVSGPLIYFGIASGRQPSAKQYVRPLGPNGHPQWSVPAMAIAAVVTSLPFAGMHAAQTGYSIGPFMLLVGVSVVLCGIRLWTKSLAASTLVHSSYNFMLFSIMLVGTSGFRHLDKL